MLASRPMILAGFLLFQAYAASGQEVAIVVPDFLAEAEGNSSAPGGQLRPDGWRLQLVYNASQFSTLREDQRMLKEFRWRPDGALRGTGGGGDPLRVSVSTTPNDSDHLDREFSQNIGVDETVVFDGEITFSTENIGPPGGPKAFDYIVPFESPFFYDPTQGNLLLDLVVRGPSTDFSLDQNLGRTGFGGFVGNPNDPDTQFATNSGRDLVLPTQFIFVPEPSGSSLLWWGALTCRFRCRRRRRTGT